MDTELGREVETPNKALIPKQSIPGRDARRGRDGRRVRFGKKRDPSSRQCRSKRDAIEVVGKTSIGGGEVRGGDPASKPKCGGGKDQM